MARIGSASRCASWLACWSMSESKGRRGGASREIPFDLPCQSPQRAPAARLVRRPAV